MTCQLIAKAVPVRHPDLQQHVVSGKALCQHGRGLAGISKDATRRGLLHATGKASLEGGSGVDETTQSNTGHQKE